MTVNDDATPSNRRDAAKSQFVRMRQIWLEQVACDREVTPIALRVAMLLSTGFNYKTLETFVSRETMVAKLRVRPGMISTGVGSLKARGHVSVRVVGRNNHYLMVIKDGRGSPIDALDAPRSEVSRDQPVSPTGTISDTLKVRETAPNRYGDPYTNRQVTGLGQGSGAYAPASPNRGAPMYSGGQQAICEEDAHALGARPFAPIDDQDHPGGVNELWDSRGKPPTEAFTMTEVEAIEEIRRVYPGPSTDPAEDLAAMLDAFENGVLHERMVALASRCGPTQEPLDEWLWLNFTRSGRQYAENEAAYNAYDGAQGDG